MKTIIILSSFLIIILISPYLSADQESNKTYPQLIELKNRSSELLEINPGDSLLISGKGIQIIKNSERSELKTSLIYASLLSIKGRSLYNLHAYSDCISCFTESLLIYRENGDSYNECLTLMMLGDSYYKLTDPVNALLNYRKALRSAINHSYDMQKAEALKAIGTIYSRTGKYKIALKHLEGSLTIYRELKNKTETAKVLTGIGHVHYLLNDIPGAEKYYLSAYRIYKELDSYTGLGRYHNIKGNILRLQKRYKDSFNHYKTALEYMEKSGNPEDVAQTLNNIAIVYSNRDMPDEALKYHLKAYQVRKSIKSNWGLVYSLINIGHNLTLKKDFQRALRYLDKGLTIARKQKSDHNILQCLSKMRTCYKNMEKYREALLCMEEEVKLRNDIFNTKKKNQIEFLELHNRLEKQKQQLILTRSTEKAQQRELKKQNKLINTYILIGALLTVTAVVNFILYRHKKRSEEIISNSRKELTRINETLVQLSGRDSLTKIANRASIVSRIRQNQITSSVGISIILCAIDINSINSELGYEAGDKYLIELTGILNEALNTSGYIARWSGSSFIILIPDTNQEEGQLYQKKIEQIIADSNIDFNNHPLKPDTSFAFNHTENEILNEEAIRETEDILMRIKGTVP